MSFSCDRLGSGRSG